LVGEEAGDVGGGGREVGGFGREERGPFVGKRIDDVYEGSVEVWFGGEAGGVVPGVPVEVLGEVFGGGGVGGEEVEEAGFELGGVERFVFEDGEVLRFLRSIAV
jgi:hypothetical protein